MGIDAGFDMVPRLSESAVDRKSWQFLIELIKKQYESDGLVEVRHNYIVFKAGEHPRLPFEGHKLLRFSSKISGRCAGGVKDYIDTVTQVAKLLFGSRVRKWSENFDETEFYNWQVVHESFRSYEQPGELNIPTTTAKYLSENHSTIGLDTKLFSIEQVPGKGKGLVARFNIDTGTRIVSEKPLFTITNLSPISLLESTIVAKLKELSKPEQREFLSLHNNLPGKYPFSGIVKTNALPCGPDSIVGGIYPTICLINHECTPNANQSWNQNLNRETIHAIRPIKAGEEITISYDTGNETSTRQAHLKSSFGFNCTCTLCSFPQLDIQASDTRRRNIELLDKAIGDAGRVMMQPEKSLADCHSLLRLIEDEYKGAASVLVASVYYDAFQISVTHGDQARASIFAERGYKRKVVCEGEDNPETGRMKGFMERPAMHRNFGASSRWKTLKGLVPKGLDEEEFERWLWREGR
ncbi:hypothetical protein SBOR_5587 [Sclerotinia borealis F-4128]|uniref:SET domain-containing protein n=1 Tax=Sclerotinia borealis (strain F-4128) TaxID=1432307 RepID=W9CGY6_SCLBF|nr:hypothetical protein SBOR_5587 [Sclerotinia borealis F-4128]